MAVKMPKMDKTTWGRIGAGAVVAILLATAVVQCNSKQDARAKCAVASATVNDLMAQKDSLARIINAQAGLLDDCSDAADSLALKNDALADSVVVLNDSIVVLNDSIAQLTADLTDCRGRKKAAPAKKPVTQKPATQKPVVRKPAAKAPATPRPADTVYVVREVPVPAMPVAPAVPAVPVQDNSGVIIQGNGQNNGTININNGTINNYHQAADTLRRTQTKINVRIKRTRIVYEY
ncbi:MAG: hypothetical protein K2L95_02890 [Alphaproteobacteria bacterium]|nr:hypothetical protein [Alphaproteobacteria bacterium]